MKKIAFLFIILFLWASTALAGTTYYVAPAASGGDNGNPGTELLPWLTITYAESQISGGDTVIVKDGTYSECIAINGVSGSLGNYTVFRSENKYGAKIQCDGTGGINACFRIASDNFIEINGFDLAYWGWGTRTEEWCDANPGSCDGHGIHSAIGTTQQHHFRFINNKIHNCGGSGIGTQDDDFLYIEGNTLYNNSYYNTFGQSPITLYYPPEISGTGDDGEYVTNLVDYFRIIIRKNYIYDNEPTNLHAGGGFQEGNGIILDRFDQYSYTKGTLVENNVIFGNANRGFHSFYTYNTVVRNNTFYYNQWAYDKIWTTQTWRPDVVVQASQNVRFYNNIIYHNSERSVSDAHQALIWDCSVGCTAENNLIYALNENVSSTYDDSPVLIQGISLATLASNNNIIAQDPLFVSGSTDPLLADFTLQAGSPAKDAGLASVCPDEDFNGNARPQGVGCDIGAYEYGSTPTISNPVPSGTQACTGPTQSVTLGVSTNEASTCIYSPVDDDFLDMSNYNSGVTFTNTGGTSHSGVTTLASNQSYIFYATCMDTSGVSNGASGTQIYFNINECTPVVEQGQVISPGAGAVKTVAPSTPGSGVFRIQ